MTYTNVFGFNRWLAPLAGVVCGMAVAACGGSEGSGGPNGTGGTRVPPPPDGCAVQTFEGEPDILVFPSLPREVSPGQTVEFSIVVDDDTRLVEATLMDAWRLRPPPSSAQPTETVMAATTGGEVTFAISTANNISGQYYVDMTLCARQCTDSRIEYTLNRANAGEGSDAINDPYERIAYQNDVEIRSTSSCFRPDAVAFQ